MTQLERSPSPSSSSHNPPVELTPVWFAPPAASQPPAPAPAPALAEPLPHTTTPAPATLNAAQPWPAVAAAAQSDRSTTQPLPLAELPPLQPPSARSSLLTSPASAPRVPSGLELADVPARPRTRTRDYVVSSTMVPLNARASTPPTSPGMRAPTPPTSPGMPASAQRARTPTQPGVKPAGAMAAPAAGVGARPASRTRVDHHIVDDDASTTGAFFGLVMLSLVVEALVARVRAVPMSDAFVGAAVSALAVYGLYFLAGQFFRRGALGIALYAVSWVLAIFGANAAAQSSETVLLWLSAAWIASPLFFGAGVLSQAISATFPRVVSWRGALAAAAVAVAIIVSAP